MRIIKTHCLGRAHELAVKLVLEKGWIIKTENNEETIEYDEIALEINNPLEEPLVSPSSHFQKKFLDQYARDLLEGSHAQFEYDYHTRLFDWGMPLRHEGDPVHLNQIDYIQRKLSSNPESRRAIAITWNPAVDQNLDDCPCLQLIQCTVRNSTLQMRVIFRSNDMLSAAGANMYALVQLQKWIASRLDLQCGRYTHISLIPHIYYIRDMTDIRSFCKEGEEIRPIPEICTACQGCKHAK